VVRRAAFTLIELIFAIVIIAISVVSLPMMNRVIADGIDANIVQEAIFASATVLNEVTTAHWDDASLEGSANSFAKVIDLGSCENNSSLINYRLMPGHIAQPLHRRCLDDNTTTPSDSNSDTSVTSLDDMEQTTAVDIFINPPTTASEDASSYKRKYKYTLNVTRPADFNGSDANIKLITMTITDASSGDTVTSLKTYSANIGEIDFYKKEY
jgi:prepilin-type N-terminal cleavage/methylation domain-containing protein